MRTAKYKTKKDLEIAIRGRMTVDMLDEGTWNMEAVVHIFGYATATKDELSRALARYERLREREKLGHRITRAVRSFIRRFVSF
jgi:hypothetical protein